MSQTYPPGWRNPMPQPAAKPAAKPVKYDPLHIKNPSALQSLGGGMPDTPATMNPGQIAHLQTFLRNHGYDLAVDGTMGPITLSAKKDFESGAAVRNPHKWNLSQHRASAVAAASTHSSDAASGGPGAATPVPTSTAPAPAAPAAVGLPDILKLLGQFGGSGVGDPAKYARAQTNAQFDPSINQSRRDIAQATTQNANKLANIEAWFSELGQSSKDGAAQAGQIMQSILGGSSADGSSAQVTNPDAAMAAGQAAGIADRGNKTQGALDIASLFNRAPIDALKGHELALQSKAIGDQQEGDLRAKLMDMLGQKGNAYTTNLGAAIKGNQAAKGDALTQLAMALQLPGQLQGQQLDLLGKQLGIKAAGIANQSNGLDVAMKKYTLAHQGQINFADPAAQAMLTNGMQAQFVTKNGGFALDPRLAWTQAQSILRQNGAANDPHAKRIVTEYFNRLLLHAHATKQWGQYKMGPNGPYVDKGSKKFTQAHK